MSGLAYVYVIRIPDTMSTTTSNNNLENCISGQLKSPVQSALTLTEQERKLVSRIKDWDEIRRGRNSWRGGEIKAKKEAESVLEYYDQGVSEYLHTDGVEDFGFELYRIGVRDSMRAVASHVSDKQCRIIDIACGSGTAALELKKHGFQHIDGLEPVSSLVARQPKDLYENMYQELIYPDRPNSIETDSYDCAILTGSVYQNQLTMEHFPQIIRIVKPGGLIIFDISDFWYKQEQFGVQLDVMTQAFLQDGTFESVLKQRVAYIYGQEDGTLCFIKLR